MALTIRNTRRTTALINPIISTLSRKISTDTTPITIETSVPFTSHNCDSPSRTVETTTSELLTFFRTMSLMRRAEIAADSLYKSKLIRGFCHLYDGQEAVAVGMEAAITKKDAIITAYRDHCTFLGRGGSLVEMFSELMGRKDGCSKGKGGSMHFYRKEANFYGGHGIVGAQVPLGVGVSFGQKYLKDESVTFALYGDGAANQGQLFEALNIAALWDLPAILVCENNHYGMGTAEWRAAKSPAYYKRGDYVPGLKVDGMDVLAVKQACKFAKEFSLKNGPIILEMDTYRYHGHSMSDPGSTYRTRDEISGVRQERDPIERVRKLLLSHDVATEKELKDIEKEMRKEVDQAITQAKESPMPDPSELFTNVYVKGYGVEVDGMDVLAAKQACESVKDFTLKNGPLFSGQHFMRIKPDNQRLASSSSVFMNSHQSMLKSTSAHFSSSAESQEVPLDKDSGIQSGKKHLRPLSPHLSVYKPQSSSMFSIFNRISAAMLTVIFLSFTLLTMKMGYICLSYAYFYQLFFYLSKLIPLSIEISALTLAYHVLHSGYLLLKRMK